MLLSGTTGKVLPIIKRLFISILLCLFAVSLFPTAEAVETAPASGTGDFLDQIATAGYPGAYGELLDHFTQLAEKTGVDAATKQIYDDLDKYNKWVGRISGVIDIGGKIYGEDYSEAAISASLMGISEYAGSTAGKALLATVGLSTATVTATTTAFQIWRASVAELEKQQAAVKLESLYGSIEADPVLKPRAAQSGRKLGAGDPIPVTPDSVERLWRKVLHNEGWRNLFKTYVTEELQQEWPEPGWWESMWIATDVSTYEQAKLIESKSDIKQCITGLLGYLNRLAKAEEQKTLARQSMAELSKMNQGNLKLTLQRYANALKRLPQVEAFAKDCGTTTANAIKVKNMSILDGIVAGALTNAAILQDIPEKGTYAGKRASLLSTIINCKTAAYAELSSLSKGPDTITVQIEEPGPQGNIIKEVTITNVTSTANSYINSETSVNTQENSAMTYEQAYGGTDAFMGLEEMNRRLLAIQAFDGGAWNAVPEQLKNEAWPDSEYIKLPALIFPAWNGTARSNYFFELSDYISKVIYRIRQHDQSSWLPNIGIIMKKAERIISVGKEMDKIKKDLAAIRQFLAEKPLSPDSGKQLFYYIDKFAPAIEEYYKALPKTKQQLVFFQRVSERISISHERISDDISYLYALNRSFGKARTIIEDLRNRNMQYNIGDGRTILINPAMPVKEGMTLEDYNKEGFVMSRKDADTFIAGIMEQLKDTRVFDIDSKYSIGISKYIDAQFDFIKNAWFPEHYFWIRSVYFYLISADDMDTVIKGIEQVNAEDDKFFDSIGKAFYPAHFNFHVWKQTGDKVALDFEYLNSLSRGARDNVIRRKASAMVAVLSKKLSDYNEYLRKKQRYADLLGEYSTLDGRFSNLEYDAIHVKDGQDIKLWESVVATEEEIKAFLGKVSADTDLLKWHKDVMMKRLDNMSYRLFHAREMLRNLRNRVSVPTVPSEPEFPEGVAVQKIQEFYQNFKGAYEAKNDSQIMSFISDDWQAGDGTTLSDLEEQLRNSFTVFNDIRYSLSNLTIRRTAPNRYTANYDIVITGRIFENNITREEKSTVDEEVKIDYSSGKPRISRTLNGRFWYVQ